MGNVCSGSGVSLWYVCLASVWCMWGFCVCSVCVIVWCMCELCVGVVCVACMSVGIGCVFGSVCYICVVCVRYMCGTGEVMCPL